MTDIIPCAAARKELSKKFLDFKYFALDSDATAYNPATQSGPITEITTNGGSRAEGSASHDSSTGTVTFKFTGTVSVKAICPMNSGSAGAGVGLCRYIPDSGSLPESFGNGGSLMVTFTAQMNAPA